jgi:hypothetical protein
MARRVRVVLESFEQQFERVVRPALFAQWRASA